MTVQRLRDNNIVTLLLFIIIKKRLIKVMLPRTKNVKGALYNVSNSVNMQQTC